MNTVKMGLSVRIFLVNVSIWIGTTGCAPFTAPPHVPTKGHAERSFLIAEVRSYLGTPYRYGGSDRSGMDCSGLVVRLYRDVCNLHLPHRTIALFRMGTAVSFRSLEPGDLIFFREAPGLEPSHVGVYTGNGRFIHASGSRGVISSRLSESYYRRRYAGARRIHRLL